MDYDYFVLRTAQGPQVIGPKNRRAIFSFPYYSNECTNSTDPQYAGAKLQFTGNGLEATLTFPGGVIWSFNTAGALVSIRNRLGVGLNFARNANGYLTAITNTLNNFAIHLSYGPNGLVESASTYPDGRTVTYSYDTNGCLTSVQDTAGGVTRYTWTELVFGSYHGYGIATVTDPRGVQILANTYDTGTQRISSQRLGNGGTFRFAYQGQSDGSQITRVTDPNGNAIDVHLEPTQGYSYRLRSVRDALGRTTTFHDPSSGPSFITGITDFRGRTISFSWSSAGRLLSITLPTLDGGTATTSFTYDTPWHELTAVTDELNQTTSITRDSQGLPIAITTPWNASVQLAWNAAGQLTALTPPWGGNSYTITYRPDGLPESVTNPLNESISIGYTSGGLPRSVTDALQRVVNFTYTGSARLASVEGPEGRGFSILRGAANLVARLDVTGGAVHQWGYDGSAEVASWTDPAGAPVQMVRDGNGNPLVVTERNGDRVEVTYGPTDRVEAILYRRADGTIESTVTYSYDPQTDLLVGITDSAGPDYSFTYNALDQIVSMSGPEGVTTFTRDRLGRITAAQAPGQPVITYSYDPYGRLSAVSQGAATVSFGYDAAGRRCSTTLPNGIVQQLFYDGLSRISRIEYRRNGTLIECEEYTRDAGGRIVRRERNGVLSTFSHNVHDELTGYSIPNQSASLTYDSAGNRTGQTINGVARSFTYTTANRITSDGGLAVTHNASGQPIQYGSATLIWNIRGELVRVVDGGVTTEFGYDCFGRRVYKSVNGVVTRYIYLGNDLAAETDANGNTIASYFYRPGVDMPVSRTDATGTVYYLQDLAGSVTALTRADGSLIGRYHYSPWGELVSQDSGMPPQPLKWTARELDETGLYYLRGRYYHPGTGRFLTEDPLGLDGGLNLYLFAESSPLGKRDPFGLDAGYMDDAPDAAEWLLIGDYGEGRRALFETASVSLSIGYEMTYGWLPGNDLAAGFDAALRGDFAGAALPVLPGPRLPGKGVGGGGGPPSGGFCFPAGTPVWMADGSSKPIEQVQPGDRVLSADPRSGRVGEQRVVRTFARTAQELLSIRTEDGRLVEATPEHPFWVEGKGFVAAKRLARSDLLRDRSGRALRVTEIASRRGTFAVYNFEVEATHTYFAGEAGWWVHNDCGGGGFRSAYERIRNAIADWWHGPDRLPPADQPHPPGWNESWEWRFGEGRGGESRRWFDPQGGEWRYHSPDRWHSEPHWDYNPWTEWNSKWQNIPIHPQQP